MGRVLIACEFSGVFRRAFAALGHDAWSCDKIPSEDGSNKHIVADVRTILNEGWDLLAVLHPPCPDLCNSGSKHLYIDGRKENGRYEPRWESLRRSADFYCELRDAPIKCKALENPVMHGHAKALIKPKFTQIVQPWWFGDPFFKATQFELINLPALKATNRLIPPARDTEEHKRWSAVHRERPGPNRAKNRARTFPGVAAAGAAQWGAYIPEPDQLDLFEVAA